MKYKNRNGELIGAVDRQDLILRRLYSHFAGRMLIKILICPSVSRIAGSFLDSRLSKILIPGDIRRGCRDMREYEKQSFSSYNDYFCRKRIAEACQIDREPSHLISPCDSLLSVYPIEENRHFNIKHTRYTVDTLLRSRKLAKRYAGGYACVFRLTVEDYHRYCYVDDGATTSIRRIDGVLHTVNPIANDITPIYKENTREYSILRSKNFGNILMMEVGALLVGRIVNRSGASAVKRGQEKGHFEFGGSTVILLLEPGKVRMDRDLLKNSRQGFETRVRMGEKIGVKSV